MITIASTAYDVNGPLVVKRSASTSAGGITRRVSRTAILNESSVFGYHGVTETDRDISISVKKPSSAQVARAETLFRGNKNLTVALAEGLFLCAAVRQKSTTKALTMTFYVVEKLS